MDLNSVNSYWLLLAIFPHHSLLLLSLLTLIPSVHLSSEKKRKPAWTDRILWRLKSQVLTDGEHNKNNISRSEEDEEYPLTIKQDLYTSHMEYSNSDHKPVVGTFTLEVRLWHCVIYKINW